MQGWEWPGEPTRHAVQAAASTAARHPAACLPHLPTRQSAITLTLPSSSSSSTSSASGDRTTRSFAGNSSARGASWPTAAGQRSACMPCTAKLRTAPANPANCRLTGRRARLLAAAHSCSCLHSERTSRSLASAEREQSMAMRRPEAMASSTAARWAAAAALAASRAASCCAS